MIKKTDKIAYLQKTAKSLSADLHTAQKKLVATRIKIKLGQEKKHSELKWIKHKIAFLKTILNQKLNQNDEKTK